MVSAGSEDVVREETKPFPDAKPREDWKVVELVAPTARPDGMVEFSYAVHEDAVETKPFFLESHVAQIREDHQRIVIGPNGGFMHVSGAEVQPQDVETFLASDPAAYLWVDRNEKEWIAKDGRTLAPFLFARAPWADVQGDDELDPQWQRERFTVPLADQVAQLTNERLDRAHARREDGDKR